MLNDPGYLLLVAIVLTSAGCKLLIIRLAIFGYYILLIRAFPHDLMKKSSGEPFESNLLNTSIKCMYFSKQITNDI